VSSLSVLCVSSHRFAITGLRYFRPPSEAILGVGHPQFYQSGQGNRACGAEFTGSVIHNCSFGVSFSYTQHCVRQATATFFNTFGFRWPILTFFPPIQWESKSAQRRCKHFALAVVRRTNKQTHKQTNKHTDRQGRLQYTAQLGAQCNDQRIYLE